MVAAQGNAATKAGKGNVLKIKRFSDPPKNTKADNSMHEEEVGPEELPNAVSTVCVLCISIWSDDFFQ